MAVCRSSLTEVDLNFASSFALTSSTLAFAAAEIWNAGYVEQRNRRIDRKLQPNADVYCHYFYTDRPEDRILQVLVDKTNAFSGNLVPLAA